jgi:DNA (cytosine-5)-methyltransferase 1|tara:strand:- start:5092 stop:6108 length:1017 start_codon:yes stop_codon:yes gene_type:complete
MKCLDCFSGIGGMTKLLDVEYVSMVEIDPHARAILKKRFPGVPIHDDIRTLEPPPHDILTGGFPCQDISSAGYRLGMKGEKSVLFFEMVRIIRKIHPRLVFLENVSNITSMHSVMQQIVDSLCSEGYDMTWFCLKASNIGSPMGRRRWFCLCRLMRPPTSMSVDLPDQVSRSASVSNGVYSVVKPLQQPETVVDIVMEKFQGDQKCRGNVVTKPIRRRRWATPRTRISFACRNLTYRGSNDLASQLRFATCTPADQKHLKSPHIEWVEWLMGLPIGYTDLNCENPLEHNKWLGEPVRRMGHRSKDAIKRHFRLGNMCVPQMAKKAFDLLTSRYKHGLQ